MRCSVHEAIRRLGVPVGANLEREGILVGSPAGEPGLQFLAQVRTHIQIANAGTSAKPLQNSATGEVGIKSLNVDRYGAERLESIEHDMGADLVGSLDDRPGILNEGAAEDDVRNRHEQGLFVDGIQKALGGNCDSIVRLHHVNSRAV